MELWNEGECDMGTRGPAPGLRGRANKPDSDAKLPSCPKHLSTEAEAVWDYIVPELASFGLVARADFYVLERYCRLVVEERNLSDFIAENGLSCRLVTKEGHEYNAQYTEVSQLNRVRSEMLKIEVQLGLTQAARTRIQAEPAKDKSTAVRKRKR